MYVTDCGKQLVSEAKLSISVYKPATKDMQPEFQKRSLQWEKYLNKGWKSCPKLVSTKLKF